MGVVTCIYICQTSKYLSWNRTFPEKRKISPDLESEKNVHYFEIHISVVKWSFEICDLLGWNSKLSFPIGRLSLVERDDRPKRSTVFWNGEYFLCEIIKKSTLIRHVHFNFAWGTFRLCVTSTIWGKILEPSRTFSTWWEEIKIVNRGWKENARKQPKK